MKYTIEDLKNGKCAVINDGTLDELDEVLKAFPDDKVIVLGRNKYYYALKNDKWTCTCMPNVCTLPTQSVKGFLNQYPKVMLVSNNAVCWYKRVVFMEKKDKYLAWNDAETLEEAEKIYLVGWWVYAKDIEEPIVGPITELTLSEIANKFDIKVENLRIKEDGK